MLRETFCTLILLKPAPEVVQNECESKKMCPGAGDRIRDYFVTIGVVPLAQQYHSNVTVLSRYIVTLGRDT